MQPVTLSIFDPLTASRETWAAYHAYRRVTGPELWPDDPMLGDAEVEDGMKEPSPLWETRRWLGFAGSEVVGLVRCGFRRPGTPNAEDHAPFLWGYGSVRADNRRLGVAGMLMREIHDLMRAIDKTVLTAAAHHPGGHGFLQHLGAEAKHSQIESRAMLAEIDTARLDAWEAAAEARGLTWETYAGRVPRPVLLSLLPTYTELFQDAPRGNMEHAPIRSEIAEYDRWYEWMDRISGAHHLVLLRSGDGSVAGLSDAGWDSQVPGFVYQHFTGVSRPWRGRGLGRALKARMLRQVRAHHPQAGVMVTSNADVNAPMLSINARIGFAVHRRFVTYQISRAALDSWRARAEG